MIEEVIKARLDTSLSSINRVVSRRCKLRKTKQVNKIITLLKVLFVRLCNCCVRVCTSVCARDLQCRNKVNVTVAVVVKK